MNIRSLPGLRQGASAMTLQNRNTQYSCSASPVMTDSFAPKFAAKLTFEQPTTIAQSRFSNDRIGLDTANLVPSLVEKLDEIMTVTGEVYGKNEAFTTLIDVKLPNPSALFAKNSAANGRLSAQVDHTLNVGKEKNVGIMVMSSSAKNNKGEALADARATFNAIDPESVKVGSLKPMPVTNLSLSVEDTTTNAQASVWNTSLSGFYKNVAARLGAKDASKLHPDLKQAEASKYQLVNSNVYVTTQMLNKKKTGHGGIAAGMALKDMEALLGRALNSDENLKAWPTRVSANYLDKFVESDALQFETTVDHHDGNGNFLLSTRISKLDTKSQTVQGPVILVHAQFNTGSLNNGVPIKAIYNLGIGAATEEAQQRRQEAITWAALPN